jgi:hypothetical protein
MFEVVTVLGALGLAMAFGHPGKMLLALALVVSVWPVTAWS